MIESLSIEAKLISLVSSSIFSSGLHSNNKKKININGSLIIYKKNLRNINYETNDPYPFLQIDYNGNEYKIINLKEINQNIDENSYWNDLWVEISSNTSKKSPFPFFEIKPNDTIRMGEAIMEVLAINFDENLLLNQNYTIYSSRSHSLNQNLHISNENTQQQLKRLLSSSPNTTLETTPDELLCRICYTEVSESDKNNLGITVCQCSGTMQYAHLRCLKKWINKKLKYLISADDVLIFEESELECEICLNEIPIKVLIGGVEHCLLDFEDKFRSYIVVRDLFNGLITVVNLTNQKEIYIGNGQDPGCEIIVQHDTVDEFQCKLIALKGKVYIEDCRSRNKTFLKVNEEFVINPFAERYHLVKGSYSFNIIPQKEKINFFSLFCHPGTFCNKTHMDKEKKLKELILE